MTLTPTTRASLLLRLRDCQDHAAWMEFVSLYEPIAYRLLRRHGLQDADAREVMQELFLVVSRNIDRWDPNKERGTFRGWLRRVARNLVINWLRHRERRLVPQGGSEVHVMLEMLPADAAETAEFDHEFRRAMFQRAAEQVQSDVKPATWQAFWQTAVLNRTPAEVADNLGIPIAMVRVGKCRVLARIKAAIRKMEDAE